MLQQLNQNMELAINKDKFMKKLHNWIFHVVEAKQ